MDHLARRTKALQEGLDLAADVREGCRPGLAAETPADCPEGEERLVGGAAAVPLPDPQVSELGAEVVCVHDGIRPPPAGACAAPDRRTRAVRRFGRTLRSVPHADGRGRRSGERDGGAALLLPRAPPSRAGLLTFAGTPGHIIHTGPDAHAAVPLSDRRAVPVSCPDSSRAVPADRKHVPGKPVSSMPAGQGATKPPVLRPRATQPPERTALSSSGRSGSAAVSVPAGILGIVVPGGAHTRMTTAHGHSCRSRFTLMTKPRVERSDQRSSTSVSRSSV